MKEVLSDGRIGTLRTILVPANNLFNGASHYFDNLMYLAGDRPARWVQMQLLDGDWRIEGDRLTEDPAAHGVIAFDGGLLVYVVAPVHEQEVQARCDDGSVRATQQQEFFLRRRERRDDRRAGFVDAPFPQWQPASANLRLVEDLVHALDTGEPPVGGVRVAYAATELIFAAIESHLRGGARVELPLTGSTVRLHRDRAPRQPSFEPRRS